MPLPAEQWKPSPPRLIAGIRPCGLIWTASFDEPMSATAANWRRCRLIKAGRRSVCILSAIRAALIGNLRHRLATIGSQTASAVNEKTLAAARV
jgi:hypothetical protein